LHISNAEVAIEINEKIKAQMQKLNKLQYNNVIQWAQCKIPMLTVIKLNKPHVLCNLCVNTLS